MAEPAGDAAESSSTTSSVQQRLVSAALGLSVERRAPAGGAVSFVRYQRAVPELRVRDVPHHGGRAAAWGNSNSSSSNSGAHRPPAFAQRAKPAPGPKGHRHHHHHHQHQHRTVASIEFESGVKLAKRNFLSRKPWHDGVLVMWIVVSNTFTSLAVAWAVALLYAVGSPLASFYPAVFASADLNPTASAGASGSQSGPESSQVVKFYGVTGLYFVLFACIVHAVPTAVLVSRRVVGYSESRTIRPQGSRHALAQTLVSTWYVLALALAAGTAFVVLMAMEHVPFRKYGRLHVYIMCAIAYAYAFFADFKMKAARRLRAQEIHKSLRVPPPKPSHVVSAQAAGPQRVAPATEVPGTPATTMVEISSHTPGLAAGPKSADPRATTRPSIAARHSSHETRSQHVHAHRRVQRRVPLSARGVGAQAHQAVGAAALRVHEPAAQDLDLGSHQEVPAERAAHLVMTVLAIAIDAQIRMVFIQNGGGQSIVATSIAIVFCEIFFRIAKILRLRYSIAARLAERKGMQRILKRVNSKLAVRDVGNARAEYAEFLNWKNYVLRLHAAEVYADMHAEYISIAMSTAVVIFMSDHRMFDLSSSTSLGTGGGGGGPDHSQRILTAMFQMGTGLAFDYLSSVVEGVHEVPLYESIAGEGASLRVLLHVLLSTLTAVNVGIIGLFYIKSF